MQSSVLEDTLSGPNSFYRKNYQAVIVILILGIFIMLGMVVAVLYQVSHRPLPLFDAAAANNKLMTLRAFNEPNLQPDVLLRWASKAAVASYTFDFVNYNKEIALAYPYYTSEGWSDYQASVSRLINEISQKQLFVNGVVSGPPVIASQCEFPKKGYTWNVQMPFLVTYQSSEHTERTNYYVLMTIVRVPTQKNPQGIGINQFSMR
jgi:intracellular multiplication protein IcmL